MSIIHIHDLPRNQELDGKAMSAVRGGAAAAAGNAWLAGLGPVANVNVNVIQDINQLQNVEVNALNNVGVIGAGVGPLRFDVNPKQFANANTLL